MLANLKPEMYTNKTHIFSLDKLALNARKTTVFHQIMESLSEQIQDHNLFEEILWNQYEFTNEVTATNVLHSTFGYREYHFSFIGGDETDAERTHQNETIVNDNFGGHSSNTESNSQHTRSEVVHILDSFSETPENHIICLGRCCFYSDLTNVNTKTVFEFLKQTTSPNEEEI